MDPQIGVDPVDEAGVHVRHLKQGEHLRLPGAAIDPDHVRHPQDLPFFNDHGHARTDMEEHLIRIGS